MVIEVSRRDAILILSLSMKTNHILEIIDLPIRYFDFSLLEFDE